MVNLKYVKDHKKKKIAAWVSVISTIVVIAFMILAFMGRSVGSFTVALKKATVSLALDTSVSCTNPQTLLKVDKLPSFDLCTNSAISEHDQLDNEVTTYKDIGIKLKPGTDEVLYMYYLKYTFFVKNVGTSLAAYDLDIKITDNVKATNVAYTFDDVIRVRLYDNDGNKPDDHNFRTFAKRVRNAEDAFYDKETQELIYDSPISGSPIDDDFPGFAEQFADDTTIAKLTVNNFKVGDVRRYTLVLWVEGDDYECKGDAPDNGSIKLGVDINAYQG